jgi:hypothetical protein
LYFIFNARSSEGQMGNFKSEISETESRKQKTEVRSQKRVTITHPGQTREIEARRTKEHLL